MPEGRRVTGGDRFGAEIAWPRFSGIERSYSEVTINRW
jgi:hypothetical protein